MESSVLSSLAVGLLCAAEAERFTVNFWM